MKDPILGRFTIDLADKTITPEDCSIASSIVRFHSSLKFLKRADNHTVELAAMFPGMKWDEIKRASIKALKEERSRLVKLIINNDPSKRDELFAFLFSKQ